jgi:DNA-binding NarL/FixJ family response regulator
MTRTRVLVADDLSSVSSAVAALLPESFDLVGTVSDGRTALETTLNLKPDVIILDISMPEMNGIEVARELRKQHSEAKIVFLTVHEDWRTRIRREVADGQ